MIIPQDTISKWRLLLRSGDKTKISEAFKEKYPDYALNTIQQWVGMVFKFGICENESLFPVIRKYFEDVEKKQSKPVK